MSPSKLTCVPQSFDYKHPILPGSAQCVCLGFSLSTKSKSISGFPLYTPPALSSPNPSPLPFPCPSPPSIKYITQARSVSPTSYGSGLKVLLQAADRPSSSLHSQSTRPCLYCRRSASRSMPSMRREDALRLKRIGTHFRAIGCAERNVVVVHSEVVMMLARGR